MKITGQIEKWGAGALVASSLVLVVILTLHHNPEQMGKPRGEAKIRTRTAAVPASKSVRGEPKVKVNDELSRYDPHVELDLLREFDSRPPLELKRSPFDFGGVPVPVAPVLTAAAVPSAAELAAAAPPPPPPPVTVKPMGYSLVDGQVKGAIVSDEDQIFVVNVGGSVGSRYKVTGITPTTITIEDANPHRIVDLPIPQ